MPEEVLFHKYKNDPNIILQFMAVKAGSRENAATNQRRTDFDNDSISRLLNALANLSISLPSKEVFAIGFRFQRAKTTIFIAGNDTVPTDMQDHLRRMWAHLQMLSNCKAHTQRHRNEKDLLYGDTYKFAVQKILARMQKNIARLEAWETSFDSAAPRDRRRRNNKFKALSSLITEFSEAITTINTPAPDWETFRLQMTKATQKVSTLLENDEKREYLRGLTVTANFGAQ